MLLYNDGKRFPWTNEIDREIGKKIIRNRNIFLNTFVPQVEAIGDEKQSLR